MPMPMPMGKESDGDGPPMQKSQLALRVSIGFGGVSMLVVQRACRPDSGELPIRSRKLASVMNAKEMELSLIIDDRVKGMVLNVASIYVGQRIGRIIANVEERQKKQDMSLNKR
ncbi:uncharacterized protein LOC112271654 [Brachypodium distachyon]|uniref:uncharacterized protein LOC112271654 n=1 Tax=Brachypodium distachyon TaxID=15368 RepID=UPI000D0DA8B1|nr:uncharacterized protein LOC112271654 [Brachypodium distachyon]|eukprot:XP_024317158.1 uncharacterized protein LOC112271654 [Brachypodium distachyon]